MDQVFWKFGGGALASLDPPPIVPEQNICPIEIDPVTDEYKLTIPEWLLNDMGWYEGTELQWIQDSDIICIEEVE